MLGPGNKARTIRAVLEIDCSDRQAIQRKKLRIDVLGRDEVCAIRQELSLLFDPSKHWDISIYNDEIQSYEALSLFEGSLHTKWIRLRALERDEDSFASICGRHADFDGEVTVDGYLLKIEQNPNRSDLETAGTVWDGALLLTQYYSTNVSELQLGEAAAMLELGSGCGMAGIALAVLLKASALVLTDLEVAIPVLKRNIQSNMDTLRQAGCNLAEAKVCDWKNPAELTKLMAGPPDLIVVSDCVWTHELVVPLFSTLKLYTQDRRTQVVIAYQCRGKKTDSAFWKAVETQFRFVTPLKRATQFVPSEAFSLLICRN